MRDWASVAYATWPPAADVFVSMFDSIIAYTSVPVRMHAFADITHTVSDTLVYMVDNDNFTNLVNQMGWVEPSTFRPPVPSKTKKHKPEGSTSHTDTYEPIETPLTRKTDTLSTYGVPRLSRRHDRQPSPVHDERRTKAAPSYGNTVPSSSGGKEKTYPQAYEEESADTIDRTLRRIRNVLCRLKNLIPADVGR